MVSARMESRRAHTLAYAGLAVATVGWASGFVAGKLALGEMSPLPVAAWRYAIAATILLPFALRQRPAEGLGPAARPPVWMIVCGGGFLPRPVPPPPPRDGATNTGRPPPPDPPVPLPPAPA